jgi:AI-2 transport protein TqsA
MMPPPPPRSDRFFRLLVGAAAAVVVLAGIKMARQLIVPTLLAAFIALVSAPIVLWLRSRRVPAGAAVAIALTIDLAAIALLGSVLAHSLVGFEDRVPEYAQQVDTAASALGLRLSEAVSATSLTVVARSVIASFAAVLSDLVLVLLVVTFMLLEVTGLRRKLESLIPAPENFERIHLIARDVNRYLAVKFVASAATGVLAGAICAIAGVDLPIVWGLLAFLLNFIPTIGSIIAAVPPTFLAIAQHGIGIALLVLVGYIAVNFTIGNFLEPRILGRTLGLSPLVVLLSMIVWGWLLGPVGAVLAVPLTTIIKIAADGVPELRWVGVILGPGPPAPRDDPAARRSASA